MEKSKDGILIKPKRKSLWEIHSDFKEDPVEIKRLEQSKTQPRQL
jgi:hypothetical protein